MSIAGDEFGLFESVCELYYNYYSPVLCLECERIIALASLVAFCDTLG